MPTTINASNTTGGAVVTGDGSGVLELQSGGVTGITVNGANVTVAGTLTATGGVSGVSLTTGVTGVLPVANGGTNSTATATAGGVGYGTGTAHAYTAAGTAGGVLYSAGSGAPAFSAAGASGQVLTSTGSGAPAWASASLTGFTKLSSVAFTPTMSINSYSIGQAYTIDADRVLYITGDSSGGLRGFVFNKTTNTMGTTVVLRSVSGVASSRGNFRAIVISPSSVLLASLPASSTALQAVILSISGTTITVNTAGSVTSATNGDGTGIGLIAIGSSYVICGSDASTSGINWAVALTVSGTTVTFPGSVTTISGSPTSAARPQPFDIGSSRVAFLVGTTALSVYTFTVSGTTLTSIASANAGASTYNGGTIVGTLLSSGRLGIVWLNPPTGTPYGAICSFNAGGTPSISSVQLTSNSALTALGCSVVGSQIACYMFGNTGSHSINVLTDNAGTAVAGTAYSYTATGVGQRVKITNTGMWLITSTTGSPVIFDVTISGNNPVVTPIGAISSQNTGISFPVVGASDTYLGIAGSNPQAPYGSSYFISSSGRVITNANNSTASPVSVSFDGTTIKSYVGEMFPSWGIRETDSIVGVITPSSDNGPFNTKFIFERWQFVG